MFRGGMQLPLKIKSHYQVGEMRGAGGGVGEQAGVHVSMFLGDLVN
jgi:hypothetical protein